MREKACFTKEARRGCVLDTKAEKVAKRRVDCSGKGGKRAIFLKGAQIAAIYSPFGTRCGDRRRVFFRAHGDYIF